MPDAIRQTQGNVLRSAFPVMTSLFAIAAIPFLISAVLTRESEFVTLCVGCILAALVCFPKIKPGKRFEVTENGIDIDKGKLLIGWEQIDSCAFGGYKLSPELAMSMQNRPVTINYAGNSVRLSVDLPNSNTDFYRSLWNLLCSTCQPNLTEPLATTYRAAIEKYGPSNIIAAGTEAKVIGVRISGRVIFGLIVFFLLALVGANLGGQRGVAVGFASFSGIVLTVFTILFVVERVRRRSKNDGGGIILTPQQLSLQIKNLKGSLKWSELKDVALTPSARKPIRLRLRVAGADIALDDNFQLPLWFLCERAQYLQTNYKVEQQQATIGQNQTVADVPEVEEDYNPFRPPRT